jgi:hypothetical protein
LSPEDFVSCNPKPSFGSTQTNDSIGWKTYTVNASWDVLEVFFVVLYWVETSKLYLEEIDEVFEVEMRLGAGNIIQAVDIEDAKTSCM